MRVRLPTVQGTASFLVFALCASATAGSSAEDEERRIADRRWFVRELGRGWEPLLSDMDRTIDGLRSEPAAAVLPIRKQRDETRDAVARMNLDRGEQGETRALQLFEVLAETAVDESQRPGYHQSCADIYMERSDRAAKAGGDANDAKAFDFAKAALQHVPKLERALGTIGKLGRKVGLAAAAREEFESALAKLQETVSTLMELGGGESTAVAEVQKDISGIKSITGQLRIEWLGDWSVLGAVKGAKADYRKAKLTFSAQGKTPPPAQSADVPKILRTGRWTVTATGEGLPTPFRTEVEVRTDGGQMTLLTALPEGMVLVPAAGAAEPFLCDRTEWSNAQYRAVTGKPRAGGDSLPAAGLSYEEACEAAAAAGKRIPTLAQWTHAAFGAPMAKSPRYPWGDADGEPGTHFVGGVDEPRPVDSCPAGQSPPGCLNMAGNCWEWIDHRGGGWLIGGGWRLTNFTRDFQLGDGGSWEPDFLREPLPTETLYNSFPDKADQSRYFKYYASATTLPQAGMRCVVPLGKPRR